ncbi:HAMP domain-containing sensor histidine kinase [Umezawaea sp. Da 62-37]|uniref:sensor histidine kinase n=1 Tax=Umezawaea sp. Da 62-37 TaxID=3075927 RepID=UPI0028F7244E|nr:HAMP domain-containing sensor histidine kinase [Umezawaea sp. Da 62-37]WNV85615.1 HAMP domain-containing sensor histidine kinase [Umezawaea sp. Da 62-37]
MTDLRRPPRRPLRARLTAFHAATAFVVGIVVLAVAAIPLAGLRSTTPVHGSAPAVITGTGDGIGPHGLLVGSAIALVLLVPFSSAVGWFVAGRSLRPLREITTTARAISAGNLHHRLGLGEPVDELTELGSILDDLFARLEASFDAQRHFVANASHELRTPLAGLRTLLEVTLADPDANADTLRSACEEAIALGGHQERLVQALLTLATSERGVTRRDTVDLAHVVAGVLASRREQAAHRGIGFTGHLAPAMTTGDPGLVESLVANLVDNAIRHNHRDGHVEITTLTSGSEAVLSVVNSGPVIPDDQVQRLLQPFQRLGPTRDGHGLGLAIVNAVAQAHHATLTTSARPEGGLSTTVRWRTPHHVIG